MGAGKGFQNRPTTIIPNQSFLSQNRIGGQSSVMFMGPNQPEVKGSKEEYERLYDKYYDVDRGMFNFQGVSLEDQNYFRQGWQQATRKVEAAKLKKDKFFSRGASDIGGMPPTSYTFPSSTVQQARGLSPMTQPENLL